MAITDEQVMDDELSRLLRYAYLGARSEFSCDEATATRHVERAEELLRSFIFGSEQQYERACIRHGAKLTMRDKH